MIPGEAITQPGEIELNQGRSTVVTVHRSILVGSHFHFYEVNEALNLTESDHGNDIPAGTAVRF